jgi:hypothetical protein
MKENTECIWDLINAKLWRSVVHLLCILPAHKILVLRLQYMTKRQGNSVGFVQANATSIHLFPNLAAYNSCFMNKIRCEKHV